MAQGPVKQLPTGKITGTITWTKATWNPPSTTASAIDTAFSITAYIQVPSATPGRFGTTDVVSMGHVRSVAVEESHSKKVVTYNASYEIDGLQLISPVELFVAVTSPHGSVTLAPNSPSPVAVTPTKSEPDFVMNFVLS
jgi:hypothetical protein